MTPHTKNGPHCTCPNDEFHDREIERLQNQVATLTGRADGYKRGSELHEQARNKLQAENERLRAALQRAADAPCSHCGAVWLHGERSTAHFIVQQTLGSAKPE